MKLRKASSAPWSMIALVAFFIIIDIAGIAAAYHWGMAVGECRAMESEVK